MARRIHYDKQIEQIQQQGVLLSIKIEPSAEGGYNFFHKEADAKFQEGIDALHNQISQKESFGSHDSLTTIVHLGRFARDQALNSLRAGVVSPDSNEKSSLIAKAKSLAETSIRILLNENDEQNNCEIQAEAGASFTALGRVALVSGDTNSAINAFNQAEVLINKNPDFAYFDTSNAVHSARARRIEGDVPGAVKQYIKAFITPFTAAGLERQVSFSTALRILSIIPYSKQRIASSVGKVRAYPLQKDKLFIDV